MRTLSSHPRSTYLLVLVLVACFALGFPLLLAMSTSDPDSLKSYSFESSVLSRLSSIEQGQAWEIQQITTHAANLQNVIERVRIHEAAQLNDPQAIAVLQTKMDWILRGISILLISLIGWIVKQVRNHSAIFAALGRSNDLLRERYTEMTNHVESAKVEARAAFEKANNINRKIESLGESIQAEHKAL